MAPNHGDGVSKQATKTKNVKEIVGTPFLGALGRGVVIVCNVVAIREDGRPVIMCERCTHENGFGK